MEAAEILTNTVDRFRSDHAGAMGSMLFSINAFINWSNVEIINVFLAPVMHISTDVISGTLRKHPCPQFLSACLHGAKYTAEKTTDSLTLSDGIRDIQGDAATDSS